MAHGGTNFGFYSGANTGADESDYKPDLTSYDYVRKFLIFFIKVSCSIIVMKLKTLSRMHLSKNLATLTIQNTKVY